MRCFVALDLPGALKEEIKLVQAELKEQNLFIGKFIEPDQLHITLKFFGSITPTDAEKLRKALKTVKQKAFTASLSGFGVFSEEFVRIIWAELHGVDELQRAVDAAVSGMFKNEERFMSHITLARVKSTKEKEKLINAVKKLKSNLFSVPIKSFSLMESTLTPEGSIYKVIEKYSLS